MATYRGRKSDSWRKVGFNIWGEAKCPGTERPFKPGQHGPEERMDRRSEYGEQLLAEQVIKRYYGMLERQFHGVYVKAHKAKGNTSINFLRGLELR